MFLKAEKHNYSFERQKHESRRVDAIAAGRGTVTRLPYPLLKQEDRHAR